MKPDKSHVLVLDTMAMFEGGALTTAGGGRVVPARSIAEISSRMLWRERHVYQLLDQLETEGLVKQVAGPYSGASDRPAQWAITPKGLQWLRRTFL